MGDARRRELERGLEEAALALGARLRAGELEEEQVALLAYLEVPEARELLAELDPIRLELAWRTWSEEAKELEVLSLMPNPERFTFGAWPGYIGHAIALLVKEAAEALGCEAALADPQFPVTVSESLARAVVGEALARGRPRWTAFAEALQTLARGPAWEELRLGHLLRLQAIAPLCRILGSARVESLVREGLLELILGEAQGDRASG